MAHQIDTSSSQETTLTSTTEDTERTENKTSTATRPHFQSLNKTVVMMNAEEARVAELEFQSLCSAAVADGSMTVDNHTMMMDIFWAKTHFGAQAVQISENAVPANDLL